MASRYLVQIVDSETHEVVMRFPPGLAVEKELIESVCEKLTVSGVGYFRSTDRVLNSVRMAFRDVLRDVKRLI